MSPRQRPREPRRLGAFAHDRRQYGRRSQRGVAMVEFALILPALTILAFGTIDLARAFFTYEQVKNSAREGALYAQFFPYRVAPVGSGCADPGNILYHARAESGSSGSVDTSISVKVTPAAPNGTLCDLVSAMPASGTAITVTATKGFTILTPLVAAFVNVKTISSTVRITEQR